MLTNQEKIQRAEQADQLLHNPLLLEVFDKIKNYNINKWITSVPSDTETREMCYNRHKAVLEIQREFEKILNAAKVLEK